MIRLFSLFLILAALTATSYATPGSPLNDGPEAAIVAANGLLLTAQEGPQPPPTSVIPLLVHPPYGSTPQPPPGGRGLHGQAEVLAVRGRRAPVSLRGVGRIRNYPETLLCILTPLRTAQINLGITHQLAAGGAIPAGIVLEKLQRRTAMGTLDIVDVIRPPLAHIPARTTGFQHAVAPPVQLDQKENYAFTGTATGGSGGSAAV